jgi:hypothetical protein
MAHDSLDLERTRDLRGRVAHPWVRRVLLGVLAIPVALGAAGALGQKTVTRSAAGPRALLSLDAPEVVRGGLLWRARITIRARETIDFPRLVLGRGYVNGMQLNTLEPSPAGESSRAGDLVLSYDKLDAGDVLVVYIQLQTNPTTTGEQDTNVELDDETRPLARVAHTVTVLP